MIVFDVDALNGRFWSGELTYTNDAGETVTLPDTQKLDENGMPADIDEEQPWVRWTINPGASVRHTAGENPYFKSIGTATLQVFIPKGMGTGAANDLIDSFFARFREWRSDDKALRIYKTDIVKGKDKSFYQVNATIFYESKRKG